ncbi:uncharacterized protein EI97DRAFT_433040 [Westerdykella ornata]|uniref:Uncharacterized protein n=1 Tax=Westerdykella ornata TaxID=318751 RepID=A0A6A6JLI4_WESOR|nr:uncharacterized protein EI97DRAFT_433040 [Westerdykella ornata]KAF2276808.1 hypothetical protein EI97DRAFT_433040 [Westerdykella ornata]
MAQRNPAGWAALAQEEFKRLVNTYHPGLIPKDVLEEHMRKYSQVYPVQDESKVAGLKGAEKKPIEKAPVDDADLGATGPTRDVPPAIGAAMPSAQRTVAHGLTQEAPAVPSSSASAASADQVHNTPHHQKLVPGLDARGNFVLTPTRKLRGLYPSQGLATPTSRGAQDITTPSTHHTSIAGPSIVHPSPVSYSPGPHFPRLGEEPQQQAKDDQTIQIPYPGGPVKHNPYRTLPKIPQPKLNQPRSTPINTTMNRPAHTRSGPRRGPRPKRLDQGPGASPADIYPDDSPMSDENRARASTLSGGTETRPRADTGTDRVIARPPPDPFVDNPVVNFPVAPTFPAAPTTTNAGGMDINPAYVPDWETINTRSQSSAEPMRTSSQPTRFNSAFNPYVGGQVNQHYDMGTGFRAPAPMSGYHAPTSYQYGQYLGYPTLSPIPEGSSEQTPEFNAYRTVTQGPVEAPRSAALSGISDLPYPSPLPVVSPALQFPSAPATFSQTGAHAAQLPMLQDRLAVPKTPMEPDQLDGSRYGLQRYGLGLHKLGDVWMPPRPKPGTRFSNVGYLWGHT